MDCTGCEYLSPTRGEGAKAAAPFFSKNNPMQRRIRTAMRSGGNDSPVGAGDRQEFLRLEAGAADQRAVDIGNGHQLPRIRGFD